MAKFVSFKLTDEPDLWLVDLERGVVSTMNDPTVALACSQEAPNLDSGLEMAFVTEMREDAFSSKFDK
jgi:hypothetical protein